MMKKKKNAFFLTVALATTFMTSLVLMQKPTSFGSWAKRIQVKPNKEVTINFAQGWNLIAVPLETRLMASDLCDMFGEQILDYPMAKYGEGYSGWGDLYYCNNSTNSTDFSIDPYVAFMVYITDEDFSWTFSGRNVPVSYNIVEGYNAVGVSIKRFKMVSDLCGRSVSSDHNIVKIDKWEGHYTQYLCGGNFPDYELFEGEGYFLEAESVVNPGQAKKVGDSPGLPPGQVD